MKLWIEERSDYAKEQLVLNNAGVVGIVLKSLNLNVLDEDLFATGLVGIVKAVNMFDANKGFSFSAYATQVVRNEILMTLRKKRITPSFSLDEPCKLGDGEEVSYADMIACDKNFEEEAIANAQLKKAFESLNEREKKIALLRMGGIGQREIAKVCGISQAQVSRIIKNACKKIKKKIN